MSRLPDNPNLRWRKLVTMQPWVNTTDVALASVLTLKCNRFSTTREGPKGLTVRTMADEVKRSRSTTQESLRRLERHGWVLKQPNVGRGRCNIYRLVTPDGIVDLDDEREARRLAQQAEKQREASVAAWMECVAAFNAGADEPTPDVPATAVAIIEKHFGGWRRLAGMDSLQRAGIMTEFFEQWASAQQEQLAAQV